MKLTFHERVALLELVPAQEDYAGLKEIRRLRETCAISGEEAQKYGDKQPDGGWIINFNKTGNLNEAIQIDGFTEDIMPLEPLKEKWESFGWHVLEVDGHNFEALNDAIGEAQAVFEKPSMIIAHTIPGKGIDFAERRFEWHGIPPGQGPEDRVKKTEQGAVMLNELRTLGGKIRGEHE